MKKLRAFIALFFYFLKCYLTGIVIKDINKKRYSLRFKNKGKYDIIRVK